MGSPDLGHSARRRPMSGAGTVHTPGSVSYRYLSCRVELRALAGGGLFLEQDGTRIHAHVGRRCVLFPGAWGRGDFARSSPLWTRMKLLAKAHRRTGSDLKRARNIAAAMALACLGIAHGHAQEYPARLIKLVHGFPPGGNVEVVARLLAHEMSKTLGQNIIVESKPGQAGSLAAEMVAAAEPDGYTLLLVSGAHPATAAIYKKLKYDPIDGFAWISTVSFYPFIICVRKESKLQAFADLIGSARNNSDGVSSGTAGNGSIAHMTTELLAQKARVKLLAVPYRGEA